MSSVREQVEGAVRHVAVRSLRDLTQLDGDVEYVMGLVDVLVLEAKLGVLRELSSRLRDDDEAAWAVVEELRGELSQG